MATEWTHVKDLCVGTSYTLWNRESIYPERFQFMRPLGVFQEARMIGRPYDLDILLIFDTGAYTHVFGRSLYQAGESEQDRTHKRTAAFKEELLCKVG